MKQRLIIYAQLMRLDRPVGIFLLLWPTLWALWIAGAGQPDPKVLLVFVAGVALMRSAGCVINDFADRAFDPHVKRTINRPLATGKASSQEALLLFAGLCLVAFGLVLLLNPLTIGLSFAGALLAATYPFMKRYTHWPQAYLGAAFGWAVPMAFAAQTGTVPIAAWLLFIATVLWATVYDTFYGMVDREDDLLIGVKSTAILFGEGDRLVTALLQGALLLLLFWIGYREGLGFYYYLGLAIAAGFAGYQQYLLRSREPAQYFRAFLNNNAFGAVIFGGIALHYLTA
ncbi:4-hydroxybenzoate octaprenyltransferase [Nitrosococcus oceani ATCC 19707]|uniref:4-hydroxybenzoate octaprenyltransferase n=2 Tax=Nitrosococcus oceani TaxID=1229 RepID=UBIA_NITOC|nr:4-hydroxybenzoate octaprenyltransferase [Nitrosococcus oceani]Q3JBS8.1 RecName: Full=4-hydroxybenzoate octaprenyltransferase; AltName: Full=4-HB polyprenyltransferase [Nitrosococcus oceani ATCC 19707]ABA57718.1 4-hydroxybenzoate octaprenyltransferase [Nitrosococcus oceani ATCC 19707]EDZ67637.1 4-hydroxybenzoate polyprenyl transferase [Nitrosococcus oceani AFC27]KFI19888.1 4-hydroxybenzoate polyprenyltransferase [Nitrosococcus oceani C-27]